MSQSVASYGNAAGEQDKTLTRSSVSNKNEIKISADGIAKLTFNFIDELHGDSSLEPGEVKTPPQSPRPVTMSASHNVKLMVGQSSKSQRDAEACQAKVRAILELDAIKRREEADIKKQRRLQKITEGPSSEAEEDAEKKRLEKKERKRLKKLKKEKKAAVIIDSDDEDDEGLVIPKKKKKRAEEYEPEEEEEQHGSDMRSVGGRFNMINAGPPHLPQPFPENFMGFHPMNPFMRGPRPDFHMQRGVGFHMRGRGGIRGARFPGFRPPFIHGLPRQHTPMLRDPNPLPARGHSPILAPNDNLIWTTTKPSISYAFNLRDDCTTSLLPKSPEATDEKVEISGNSSPQSSEHRKKSKKSREREKKKRRSSRKSCDLSSKRKIEKIRKSFEKPERAFSNSHDGYAERRLSKKLKLDKSSEDSEEMWDEDELQELAHTFQLSKTNHAATKEDVTQLQEDLKAAEGNLTPEGPALPPQSTEHNDLTGLTKDFDMFADSPPSYDINNKVEADISGTERNSARRDNRGGTPPKKNYTKSSANTEHHSSNTPPKSLLKEASANSSEPTSSAEKTPLQKAIEIQTRIDKLLKEDDLDASFISKIKAKSLEHKRRKEQEAVSLKKHNEALTCKKPEPQRSLTPEPPKNLNNPFRRSKSRSRHIRRSHSRSPKRQLNINRSSFSNSRHHMRNAAFPNASNSGTFNREKGRWKQSSRSPRGKRDGESMENPFKPSKHKEKNSTSKKNKSKAPLSFTAAEFLFPGGDDDSSSRKELSNDDSSSPRKNSTKKKKSTNMQDKNDSPDTDDYMDNWENDDADLDVNSSNACDSSTPMRSSSQDDVEEQMFVARFVNPSPPLTLQQSLKASTETKLHQQKSVNLATEAADKAHTPPFDLITCKQQQQQQQPASPVVSKELFGMQEIYDQFIKSVEESGVDLKSNESCFENVEESGESVTIKTTDDLYLGSNTSSSTSSSSTSSSSDSNSSTSSSSSSSTTASSSEDSNDVDESFANVTLDSPRPKPKIKDVKPVVINTEAERVTSITPPLPATITVVKVEKDVIKSPESTTPPPPIEALNEAKPAAISVLPPPPAVEPPQPTKPAAPAPPAKAPKSDVAKDFKKLKSLEGNLARIQMMRANYDSTDEISEELLKMEKLFLQEKNIILQKYAKSSTASADPKPVEPKSSEPAPKSLNSEGLQQAAPETTATAEAAAEAAKANKIFDANREAIKLTISPKRLPKTSAIFEAIGTGDEKDSKHASLESDETDFTEKLKKPAKEVAIVKPMMETKDARHSSQQRSRRLSPVISRQGHETRPRSPNSGYQRDRRRSTSRSRLSPQRRQRGRSLSVSPRRTGCGRYASPGRRGAGNSNSTIAHSRYRNSGRRSRSRSRSITRQGRRRGEFSPINMRSRRPAGSSSGHQLTSYYRKSSQAQQRGRDSRSRSRSPPRSPPLRPHSPRSPPPNMMRRRSYSRDRYTSRSPLPFKPPSPPMRRSLSPHVQRRSSLSPTMRLSSSRRSPRSSRSRSRSRSPRYDDHRHRRDDGYDRRSPTQQQQYFMQESSMDDHNASSYYYNLSPSRISLDARINIVLNGPANQENGGVVAPPYDSYSNYSQYTGQYMPFPPHPDAAAYGINYAGHQYVPMSVSSTHSGSSSSSYKPVYSNIPTIGGGEGMPPTSSVMHPNYYYGEFGNLVNDQHSSSVLKELPKATVAVQKGNVLEIVPTSEINTANGGRAMAGSGGGAQVVASGKPAKPKKSVTVSWKEEVNNRHVAAAVMRLSRESDGSSKSILKKTSAFSDEALQKEDSSNKTTKKKVYFEDGIYPNRDSGDEDRTIIEAKIQRKLRRLKKVQDIATDAEKKVKQEDIKSDSDMEDIPPPPPPPGAPPAHLEQPIFIAAHSPTFWYCHYDPIMNFVCMAKCHQPLPPRLANVGPAAGTPTTTTTQPPANTLSPNGGSTASNILGSRKDIPTFQRGSRSTDHSSPMLTLPSAPQRRDNLSTMKTMPIETIHTENSMAPHKNSFQPIPTNISSATILPQAPPHHINPMTCLPPGQQPCPPIGFMGMRINNYMRLPPSPLARPGPGFPTAGGPGMPLHMGMRHPFNMPPPAMMPPNGHGQLQQHPHLSPDFTPQQQQMQYHPHSGHLPNSPHMHHPSPYPVQPPSQHHHPIQFPHTHHPPPGVHTPPHVHHQRQPSPQFYVQSIPPPPLPNNRMGMAPMHGPSPDGTGADDANAQPNISLPAPMI